jgi:hypothetical protein
LVYCFFEPLSKRSRIKVRLWQHFRSKIFAPTASGRGPRRRTMPVRFGIITPGTKEIALDADVRGCTA